MKAASIVSGPKWAFRRLVDLARHLLADDLTWDAIGILLSVSAVVGLNWLRSQPGGVWALFASSAADATVPLLVVTLTRYWYRYHRPGQPFARVVALFNQPEVRPGVSDYLGDQMLVAGDDVRKLINPEGADLGAQKYELATYLISWLTQEKKPTKAYRATFVGPFAAAWEEWNRERSFHFRGNPTARRLPDAFDELASAVTRERGDHRRIVALDGSEFCAILHDKPENFRLFLQWHAALASKVPEFPMRLFLFTGDQALARQMSGWARGGGDLVDYGIIGEDFVFGNPADTTGRLSACVRLICRSSEVGEYVRRFDKLWSTAPTHSLNLQNYETAEDVCRYIASEESQPQNWPLEVIGLKEKERFFA